MPYKLPDDRLIQPGVAFTLAGVQYPANWLQLSTETDRAALGITWVNPEPVYDQRFYWGYDQNQQLIPKDHAQLVEQWTQQTRTTANTLLAPTDWVIVREADNGTAADPALKQWRQDIRLAAGTKVAAIEATVSTADLAAYITSAAYATWPNDPSTPVDGASSDGVVFTGDGITSGF